MLKQAAGPDVAFSGSWCVAAPNEPCSPVAWTSASDVTVIDIVLYRSTFRAGEFQTRVEEFIRQQTSVVTRSTLAKRSGPWGVHYVLL